MADIKKYEPLWGSWMVGELIGKGACSEVYKVKRTVSDTVEYAAVKFISFPVSPLDLNELKGAVKQERLKAKIAELSQDIIADFNTMQKLYDCRSLVNYREIKHVHQKDGYGFDLLILMDYHESLDRHVAQHGLESVLNGAAKMAQDTAVALEAFHKENIAHENVTPSNIFLDQNGSFLLGGRSATKRIEKRLALPQYKKDCTYLSPESYSSRDVDSSDDLYSLGIVLYSCLNGGRPPFFPPCPESVTGDDRASAFSSRTDGKPIAPPPGVDDLFGKIIAKACSFKRESRYHNPVQFQRAMKDYARWKKRYLSILDLDPKSGSLSKDKLQMLKEAEKNKLDPKGKLLYVDEPPAITGFDFCLDTDEEIELVIEDDDDDDFEDYDDDDELVDLFGDFFDEDYDDDDDDYGEYDEDDEDAYDEGDEEYDEDDDEDDDSDDGDPKYKDYVLVDENGNEIEDLDLDHLTPEALRIAKSSMFFFKYGHFIACGFYAAIIALRVFGLATNATLCYLGFLALAPLAKGIYFISGKRRWALHAYPILGTLNFAVGLLFITVTFWNVIMLLGFSILPMTGKYDHKHSTSAKNPRRRRRRS
jgi:serine/threonine protein kinase